MRSYQTDQYVASADSISDHENIRLNMIFTTTDDSVYGLSGTIWTNDLERAQWVSRQLEIGTGERCVCHDRGLTQLTNHYHAQCGSTNHKPFIGTMFVPLHVLPLMIY